MTLRMTRRAERRRVYGATASRRRRLARAKKTKPLLCAAPSASSKKPTRTCRTRRSARSRRTRRCGAGWGSVRPRTSPGRRRRRRRVLVSFSPTRPRDSPKAVTRHSKRRSLQRSSGRIERIVRFPLCHAAMTSRHRRGRRFARWYLVCCFRGSRRRATFGPGSGSARAASRGGDRAPLGSRRGTRPWTNGC